MARPGWALLAFPDRENSDPQAFGVISYRTTEFPANVSRPYDLLVVPHIGICVVVKFAPYPMPDDKDFDKDRVSELTSCIKYVESKLGLTSHLEEFYKSMNHSNISSAVMYATTPFQKYVLNQIGNLKEVLDYPISKEPSFEVSNLTNPALPVFRGKGKNHCTYLTNDGKVRFRMILVDKKEAILVTELDALGSFLLKKVDFCFYCNYNKCRYCKDERYKSASQQAAKRHVISQLIIYQCASCCLSISSRNRLISHHLTCDAVEPQSLPTAEEAVTLEEKERFLNDHLDREKDAWDRYESQLVQKRKFNEISQTASSPELIIDERESPERVKSLSKTSRTTIDKDSEEILPSGSKD